MLSSIHPFGERSRNNTFRLTAGAHIVGSTLGGAVLGVIAGALGLLVTMLVDPSTVVRTALVVAVLGLGLVLEATGRERLFPTRTRQVNENWIQSYRGWVYGGGFGAELGFGGGCDDPLQYIAEGEDGAVQADGLVVLWDPT